MKKQYTTRLRAAAGAATLLLLLAAALPLHAETIFVDAGATAGRDGLSWATAYNDLQVALDNAVSYAINRRSSSPGHRSARRGPNQLRSRYSAAAEVLEDRTLLAVTAALVGDVLTVSLDAANDAVFLQVDGGNIDVGTTEGGEDVLADQAGVATIIIQETSGTGELGQSVTFSLGDAAFTQDVTSTDIETVNLNQDITGTVSGNAETVNVDDPGQIQDGIHFAAAGATVNVAAGTYAGPIVIDQALTLNGANAGVHPAVGTSTTETVGMRGSESIIAIDGGIAINAEANDITIDGFRFEGEDSRAVSSINQDTDRLHITNNIVAFTNNSQDVIKIQNGSNTGMVFDFNLFQHTGSGASFQPEGADPVQNFDNLRIANNLFNGEGAAIFQATPIALSGAEIVENEFDGTIGGVPGIGSGLNIGKGGDISIRDNYFHDLLFTAFQVGIENGEVLGNTFERMHAFAGSFGQAFELWGGEFSTTVSNNVTIANNIIHYNDVPGAAEPTHGFRLRPPETGSGIDASTIHISGNAFLDGGVRTDAFTVRHFGDQTTAVDASGNWWDTTGENAILALMEGPVDFTPFLASGTDTDLMTAGFQGDFSSLIVTTVGEQIGPDGRIEEAANLAADGGTVNVNDGTYTENATIDNNVTIQSTALDPAAVVVDGNAAGSVFTIAAGNTVMLDFFTIQNGMAGNNGGGINNAGDLTITNSTIQNNTADNDGGIFNNSGTATITGVTDISGNGTGIHVAGGTVFVNGTIDGNGMLDGSADNVIVADGGTLAGSGTIDGAVSVESGGTVAPGTSPGILNVGDTVLMAGALFDVEVNGVTTAGTDYDQLNVTGTIDVTGAILNLSGTVTGTMLGDEAVIINNDAADPVVGEFDGLADGDTVIINGEMFRIFYSGGDGNDVVLAALPAVLDEVFVNDDFTGPDNTIIPDADPNTAGDQLAMIGDNAFDTIQEGVDAGGTVFITDDIDTGGDGPGMYVENVSINKDAMIIATEGDPAAVVVDGNAAGSVFTIQAGNTVTLDSFTIQNGSASSGGGINNAGDLTINNSTIQNNTAGNNGGGMYNFGSSPTLTNVSFSGNSATDDGGGMYNEDDSSPTLTGVTFSSNSANSGGGMSNVDSSPTLANVTFSGNSAVFGGGMFNELDSNPTLANVIFSGNSASSAGGGMYNLSSSSPTLTNVTFTGNSAADFGGGMFNEDDSSPTLTGVTFTSNSADDAGGGMYNADNSSPVLTNVIIWGNQAGGSTGSTSASIFNFESNPSFPSNPSISYSLIANSGGSGAGWEDDIGTDGGNNIDADPQFVTPVSPGDAPTTAGNLRLLAFSPAINAGDNNALPPDTNDLDGDSDTDEPIPFDLAGNDRIFDNGTVDMGAYEFQGEPELPEGADNRILLANTDTYIFTPADFGQTDNSFLVVIENLPGGFNGALELDGSDVNTDDEISVADIDNGDLTYTPPEDLYGYGLDSFDFTIDDDLGNQSEESFTMSLDVAATSVDLEFEGEGWRFLASPVNGETIGEFFGPIWTQGFTDSDSPEAEFINLQMLNQQEYGWEPVGDDDDEMTVGQSTIVFVFSDDDNNGTPDGFPKMLTSSTDDWDLLDGSFGGEQFYDADQQETGDSFLLLGNPHPIAVDFCETTRDNVAGNAYFWDPSANSGNGGYQNLSCAIEDVEIAPFQGFWLRVTDSSNNFEIPTDAYMDGTTDGYFKEPSNPSADGLEDLPLLSFRVRGMDETFTTTTRILFSEQASAGSDLMDAPKLSSAGLAQRYLSLYSLDGNDQPYALQALPKAIDEKVRIPLDIQTTESGGFILDWTLPESHIFNAGYFLRDNQTGEAIELHKGADYRFEIEPGQSVSRRMSGESTHPPVPWGMSIPAPGEIINSITHRMNSGAEPRFELLITADGVDGLTELGAVPEVFELAQNYPNPFNPATVIRYQLPASSEVRLEVYDMIGRRVATLVSGQVAAGRHTVNFDAGGLSSGVYLYRLAAGSTIITKKLTVVK